MKVDDDGHPFILLMAPRLVAVLKEQIASCKKPSPASRSGCCGPAMPVSPKIRSSSRSRKTPCAICSWIR
jgi:hypothetical protein